MAVRRLSGGCQAIANKNLLEIPSLAPTSSEEVKDKSSARVNRACGGVCTGHRRDRWEYGIVTGHSRYLHDLPGSELEKRSAGASPIWRMLRAGVGMSAWLYASPPRNERNGAEGNVLW
jgi:hypothetical protein